MKTVTRFYSIFNYEKEQEFLRKMHKSGWKLVKMTGLGRFRFEECPQEDVVYQLDYNLEAQKSEEEYIQMFADCGWEFVGKFADWYYFRKPASEMNGEEGIFCDDDSRLQLIKRVFKGKMLPLFLIFTAVLLPQFFLQFYIWEHYIMASLIGGIILLYLVVFLQFAVKYIRFKNKLNR